MRYLGAGIAPAGPPPTEIVSPLCNARSMHDPWVALDRLTDWVVVWARTGRPGRCYYPEQTIALDPRLREPQLRCILMHEVIHAERGPVPRWQRDREEAVVAREAARRLIGFRELGEALAWSPHAAVVADVLWVDEPTLEVRLAHLHPSERHYLARRLADVHTP